MGDPAREIDPVPVFAALGDRTRLSLVEALSAGKPQSISALASGSGMSRQAITKHLNVLEMAGLVANDRVGRQTFYRLEPAGLVAAGDYLASVSRHWDDAIDRLKDFLGEH